MRNNKNPLFTIDEQGAVDKVNVAAEVSRVANITAQSKDNGRATIVTTYNCCHNKKLE